MAIAVVNRVSDRWAMPLLTATVSPFRHRRVRAPEPGSTAASRRSRSDANSLEKLPESLRASPPTDTTVSEDGSPDAPGVIRSQSRRRRMASEPISPSTIATPATRR